jgi:hypothetical protein
MGIFLVMVIFIVLVRPVTDHVVRVARLDLLFLVALGHMVRFIPRLRSMASVLLQAGERLTGILVPPSNNRPFRRLLRTGSSSTATGSNTVITLTRVLVGLSRRRRDLLPRFRLSRLLNVTMTMTMTMTLFKS